MAFRNHCLHWGCALLVVSLPGCGGGGSGSNHTGKVPDRPQPAVLGIVTQWPLDRDEQVPAASRIAVQFDGPLVPASLRDGQTFVEERETGDRVPCDLSVHTDGSTLLIDPVGDLDTETWYVCHLSPLLADLHERLLEEDLSFTFRTADVTPPEHVSTSIAEGARGVPRDTSITVRFSETLDPRSIGPDTVQLVDADGRTHPLDVEAVDSLLECKPVRDLLPLQRYTLSVQAGAGGVRDRHGNALQADVSTWFETATDTRAPRIVQTYPVRFTPEASPLAQVLVGFDESMDTATAGTGAFTFRDQFGALVDYDLHVEPDHRLFRLVPRAPMAPGRSYTVKVHDGPGGITDLAGQPLASSESILLVIVTDAAPPRPLRQSPGDGSNRISTNVRPTFAFDEALDATRVNSSTFRLHGPDGPVSVYVTLTDADKTVTLVPTSLLPSGQRFELTVKGGPNGIRDRVGNLLPADLTSAFFTSVDTTPPRITTSPIHGHSSVSPSSRFTAVFTEPLDPASVHALTVVVTDAHNTTVPGTLSLAGGNRIIAFEPATPYRSGEWYSVLLRDGEDGIREQSGSWLGAPVKTSFRIANATDIVPPNVSVSLNRTADRRKQDLAVSRSGFQLTVNADDPTNFNIDFSSIHVELEGPGPVPSPAAILAGADIQAAELNYTIPIEQKLAPGEYTMRARVRDMAGNEATSEPLTFRVVDFDAATMPFERTQVVWVRFDLDRDRNGRSDFEDDLMRLGLTTEGDPAGTNARMIALMRDGVLSQAHQIYERKANGGRAGPDSIAVLFSAVRPAGVAYSQIAVGGLDPTGKPGRVYGDGSSGILGRAWFDARNANRFDDNTATNPGLGVFTGELFLFEVETHLSVYPVFITTFARRFMKLVTQMGGSSVGRHDADRTVLARGFDPATASSAQRQRYFDIMLAADDWASATGVILAHEIGHAVGLTAVGAPPSGLHGDRSLHNHFPTLGEVMSSAVGYDSIVTLDFRFRDLNVAYLRQRVLMK